MGPKGVVKPVSVFRGIVERRFLPRAAGALLGLVALLALSRAGHAARPVVTIAVNPGGSYQTMHGILLPEFERAHPQIDLRVELVTAPAQQIPVRHAAGTAPDVYILSSYTVPEYIVNQMVAPVRLDVFGVTTYEELAAQYVPGFDQLLLHDGKVYWIPLEVNSFALYFNPDHFAQAGVAEAPATWEDVLTLVNRLDAQKDDPDAPTSITWQAGAFWAVAWWITFLRQNGVEWLNDAGEPQFNHPLARRALEAYAAFFDGRRTSTAWTDFANGRTTLMPGATYQMFHILRTGTGVAPAVAPFPALKGGTRSSPTYAAGWVVSTQSEHPEAAWRLVRFLSGPEQAERWWREVLLLQPRRGEWVNPILGEYPWLQIFLDEFAHAHHYVYHPNYVMVRDAIDWANRALIGGAADLGAILERLQTELSAAVKR